MSTVEFQALIEAMEAKAFRDTLRGTLIAVLARTKGLPDEVLALLRADTKATQELEKTLTPEAA